MGCWRLDSAQRSARSWSLTGRDDRWVKVCDRRVAVPVGGVVTATVAVAR